MLGENIDFKLYFQHFRTFSELLDPQSSPQYNFKLEDETLHLAPRLGRLKIICIASKTSCYIHRWKENLVLLKKLLTW